MFCVQRPFAKVFCKNKVGGIDRGKIRLDTLETKQQDSFLSNLVKSNENGNCAFSEECITTEELNNAFFMTQIQYNCIVSLDKFMMNADIKLFLIGLGCTRFDNLNEKEVQYAGTERYNVPVWEKFRNRATMNEY